MRAKLEELNVLDNGRESLNFESIDTYLSIIDNARIKTVFEGETQIAQVDIIDSSAQYDAIKVAETIGANMVQELEGNGELHYNVSVPQKVYRLYFMLDKPVELKRANEIEEGLLTRIRKVFKLIDINKGTNKKDLRPTLDKDRDIKIEVTETGYEITNHKDYIKTGEFRTLKKDERDLEDISNEAQAMLMENVYQDEELIVMSKFLSAKDTLNISENEFTRIAIGLWNSQQMGRLKEDTVIEVLNNLNIKANVKDSIESFKIDINDNNYEGRRATVGSFIQFAGSNGYDRGFYNRFYVEKKSMNHMNTKEVMIKQYIGEDNMYELFVNPYQSILVDAQTGSGKSYSSIMAGRRWLEVDPSNRYLYFAMPSVILSEQSTDGGEHGKALTGTRTPGEISQYNKELTGLNFVIGTYDKAEWHISEIKRLDPTAEITVIADEAHKEVFDYFYRSKAIKGLYGLRDTVDKFIGLSGTPEEVNKEYYHQLVKFTVKDSRPIFNNFITPTYHKMKEFDLTVVSLIHREVKAGRKVLAFVNNIEKIEDYQKVIEDEEIDIKSVGVHANVRKDTPEGDARDYLINEEKFPEGYDVVIATSVISDGINILNENEDYSVIIAPDRQTSPLFNTSVIKQMSNRFRNQYENIIIPVFVTENASDRRLNHTAPYGIETRYQALVTQSKVIGEYLDKEFGDRFDEYHPSLLELASGFPHVSSHHENKPLVLAQMSVEEILERYRALEVNPNLEYKPLDAKIEEWVLNTKEQIFKPDERKLRKIASKDAEAYYSYFPFAFIKALEDILELEPKQCSVDDFLATGDNKESLDLMNNLLALNKELKKEEDEEKEARRKEVLTKEVYQELKRLYYKYNKSNPTHRDIWKHVIDSMSKLDIKILQNNIGLVGYETMLKLMNNITRDREVNLFSRRLNAIEDIKSFEKSTSVSMTNTLFTELARFFNDESNYYTESKGVKVLLNRDINEFVEELTLKYSSLNIEKSRVNQVIDRYFVFDNFRTADGRGKGNISPISLVSMSIIYGVSNEEINDIYEEHRYSESA